MCTSSRHSTSCHALQLSFVGVFGTQNPTTSERWLYLRFAMCMSVCVCVYKGNNVISKNEIFGSLEFSSRSCSVEWISAEPSKETLN